MFTMLAYRGTPTAGGDFEYLTPIPDQHLRVEGYNCIVPLDLPNFLGAFVIGDDVARARVESPSLRRTLLYDITPVSNVIPPVANDYFPKLFDAPIPLEPSEPMRVLGLSTETTPSAINAFVWLGDGPQVGSPVESYTVACEEVSTSTFYEWESNPLFFEQTLPAGRYQLVGARVEGASVLAARFIFVGQAWRPGVIGLADHTGYEWERFRRGGLGVWGEFTHDQPPVLESFSRASGTVRVYLDLVKVG